jgi:hypothetical protein
MGTPAGADAEGGSPVPPEEEKKGLFANPVARIVGIIVAVFVVLGLIGLVFFLVTSFIFVNEAQDMLDETLEQPITESGESVEATEAAAVEPEPIDYETIFTFRDIFDPLLKAPCSGDESSTVDGTADGTAEGKFTADSSDGTLFIQAIVIQDGVSTAVALYEETEYRLVEGDDIPGTPWEALTVNESSVVMLYGDQQVVLSVGQGTTR